MPQRDAIALAQAIAVGELGAEEVLRAAIQRSEAVNPEVNAVCNPAFDSALQEARQIDDELVAARRHEDRLRTLREQRPLLGVPSLLKDHRTQAVNIPTSMGSRFFGQIEWPQDCELVARQRQAGLVFFARSTAPEMGLSPSTEAVAYGGPTRNPWGPAYSAGGSSGGAAAAIASGIVNIAHASDGAGSIRIPASVCGLFGLKPSRGLMPNGPDGDSGGGLYTQHVLTVSVRDSALTLDRTAGSDRGAPYAAPSAPMPYLHHVQDAVAAVSDNGRTKGPALRIAVSHHTGTGTPLDQEVLSVLTQAADCLRALGHEVIEADPPISPEATLRPMLSIFAAATALAVKRRETQLGRGVREDELEPTTLSAVRYGRTLDAAAYIEALGQLNAITRQMAHFLHGDHEPGYDLLLTPVLAAPPIALGRIAMSHPDFLEYRLGPDGVIHYSPFTPLANAAGLPSASVPFGQSAAGLPIGIQVTGRFGEDWRILEIAAQLEHVHPWPFYAPGIKHNHP